VLCSRCQALIVEYYTGSHPYLNHFSFKHGSLTELRDSARAGCPTCGLVSQTLKETREYDPWISGSYERSVLHWSNLTLELYNPGKFAYQDSQMPLVDEPVEDIEEADYYQPPGLEKPSDPERDAPPRTDDPACFDLVKIWM